ncbi:MAG: coagulation factor 5/8 type domain protein [Mucilaginibacter sp.]|nr:coagulation factor 5/8 type domain protein [Mucilaginibacter sp.]
MKQIFSLLLLFLGLFVQAANKTKIFTYPLPAIYHQSQLFSLQVSGIAVPVVDYNPKYDYAEFSMSKGSVKISVTLPEGTEVNDYYISPRKLAISAVKKGNQLIFTLVKDAYIIVKINKLKELVIAADAEEKDKPQSSGKGIFNISSSKYHADASGKNLTTEAIQHAIDDASAWHNGIVYVPAGVYTIGNLNLKSNMSLYLEGGAVLFFSGHPQDYKVSARKASQNRNITWWLYTDSGAHHIKIYGRGTIDGNGKYATNKENNIGNHILAIMHATDFVFDGPIIKESGAWAVIPTRSKNVVIKNFKLFNRLDMGENDGIDVMESDNVLVQHGIGISLDDPFSTKTWTQNTDLCRNWPGHPLPQNNIVFDDLLSWTYCYAYKIGQGIMQPQTNITFKNSVVYDAAVAVGVHHKWGTSYVKGVTFDNIEVEKLTHQNDDHRTWCVLFMQNGDKLGSGPISDIMIENMKIYDPGISPGKIKGVSPATQISNITFKNINMVSLGRDAETLQEMNVRDTLNYNNIKIKN